MFRKTSWAGDSTRLEDREKGGRSSAATVEMNRFERQMESPAGDLVVRALDSHMVDHG